MTDTTTFGLHEGSAPSGRRTRLVVHFGGHKTGSSSIQETLQAGNDPKNGFVFLFCGHPNSSAMMQNAFLLPEKLLSIRASEATRADLPAMRDWARTHLRRIILEGIAARPEGPLILSAESISSFVPEEVDMMLAFFQDLPVEPEFIGYIREPAAYLRSSYQEILKLRMPPNPVFAPADATVLPLTHHAVVETLDRRVGRERVQVFIYDRASFPEGSVVRHFFSLLGVDPGAFTRIDSNQGMSQLAVKLLYTYRRLGDCPFANRGPRRVEHKFAEDLGRLQDVPFELHPELRDKARAVNSHIFGWAEARLGRPFPEPEAKAGTGIRSEADLLRFSDEELAKLSAHAAEFGISTADLSADPRAVAEVLCRIRQSYG
ncbi:hypothetical protein PUH89_15120 [Rhodobacter capsulatus]|uniref:Uncharacterized protein n=1 Tax=Rhodobacter capsulatus TaxID=1061 RepID=A0A1G7KKD9_RHOCA|nr:hypothetical protein [Rhodobacter capsulatus]WER08625.1 hypothetical protein PUH89_15120 [Rhodobacter capsulatus]SDF37269.1 hypothetical protein SAMN04244550_02122 [Rhodobacter capsulatus]